MASISDIPAEGPRASLRPSTDWPITRRFLMGRGREDIPVDELDALEDAAGEIAQVGPRQLIVRRGERVQHSCFLMEGFACRYMDDRDGHRQLVAVHVPGDFIDLHGYPMHRLDHDIATLGPVKLAYFERPALDRLTDRYRILTRMLWFSTLLDAAMHREWIFRLGRLNAEGRLAHFFCELETRLRMVGLVDDGRFPLAMTQADLAEACGVTGVHTNRVLRVLREAGLVRFGNGEVTLHDRARLAAIGEFDGAYLYGPEGDWGNGLGKKR